MSYLDLTIKEIHEALKEGKVTPVQLTEEAIELAKSNTNNLLEATNYEQALKEAEGDEVFITGGESVYKAFLPSADNIYLTEVDASCGDADAFFPDFDKGKYTCTLLGENENNGIKFAHILYKRK